MSKKTVLNVKTDEKVKNEAKKIAKELGIPLSLVVNGYLKQFIRDKEITFSSTPRMSKKLEKTIAVVQKDVQEDKNMSPVFESGAEMDAWLAKQKKNS